MELQTILENGNNACAINANNAQCKFDTALTGEQDTGWKDKNFNLEIYFILKPHHAWSPVKWFELISQLSIYDYFTNDLQSDLMTVTLFDFSAKKHKCVVWRFCMLMNMYTKWKHVRLATAI